jgi:DNA polymerase III subunit alpha
MSNNQFCHLHVHTQYSLLDGASRVGDAVKRARKMGQTALAITDHGNMFGAIEFYKQCMDTLKDAEKSGQPGVKPIIGMEAYIVPDGQSRTKREKVDGNYDHHMLLWAADNDGYKNLMKLASAAYTEGFYYHPRIDRDILAAHSKGVIASSGCIGSEVPQSILNRSYERAVKDAGIYQDCIHLVDSPAANEAMHELATMQKKVNETVIELAKKMGGKLIATNDSHYTDRSDAMAHDALICIGTGKLLTDTQRLKFACDEFYLKSTEEMTALFGDQPDALKNTMEIAERCNLKIKFGDYHFPVFKIPNDGDPNEYFRHQVMEGLKARYGNPIPDAVLARANEELRVLIKMGFVGYLLIVWDIIREARNRGIPVGPGRGSAAGSIACYALGITNLEPLRYNLIFERFVNEGRNEMPDIDIDFCQSRRSEVINYVQDKYGRDCTANIITFNAMLAKGAVRDVGRVLEWELAEVNNIAKLIPNDPGKKVTLKPAPNPRADNDATVYAIDDVEELKAIYDNNDRARQLIDMARKCEGISRNTGCHAAGLVIADKPVTEYCPLYRDKNGVTLTQYEMQHIDPVGLLKIDFLGLETLTKLTVTSRLIKERHGTSVKEPLTEEGLIDLDKISLDDPKTYKMLSRGDARAVFQFESEGMRKLLTEARPDCLEDLVALNAMYRPGPMENIPSFCARKHGREPLEYMLPQLEPILKDTYGIIVYQEQVMQIANQLGGFSLSEADSLRKAMGKKKKDLMEKYGKLFEEGCLKIGIPVEKSRELYALIEKFASYGFNKSHAAAYALVAYQTAYLKANYPAEFMAGNMSLEQGNTDKVVEYIDESRRMGLDVLPPDINKSGIRFGIENDRLLRFSLGAIKGVGEKAVESIVEERTKNGPFKDIFDFCERVDSKNANKGCLESLVKAGAFDTISGKKRAAVMAALEEAIAQGATMRQDRSSGQGNLFGGGGEGDSVAAKPRLPQIAEWTDRKRLEEEKSVLGFYLSGHPLGEVRELVEGCSSCSIKGLSDIPDGFIVTIGAYVTNVLTTVTKAKQEKMAILTVEDFSGSTKAVIFPRTYARFKDLLAPDKILFFRGKVKVDEGGGGAKKQEGEEGGSGPMMTLMPDEILLPDQAGEIFVNNVSLTITDSVQSADGEPAKVEKGHAAKARIQSVANLLRTHPGSTQVYLNLEVEDDTGQPATVTVCPSDKWKVRASPEFLSGVRGILERGSVKITGEAATRAQKPQLPAWKQRPQQNAQQN